MILQHSSVVAALLKLKKSSYGYCRTSAITRAIGFKIGIAPVSPRVCFRDIPSGEKIALMVASGFEVVLMWFRAIGEQFVEPETLKPESQIVGRIQQVYPLRGFLYSTL